VINAFRTVFIYTCDVSIRKELFSSFRTDFSTKHLLARFRD